jgi:hypothetical protein
MDKKVFLFFGWGGGGVLGRIEFFLFQYINSP